MEEKNNNKGENKSKKEIFKRIISTLFIVCGVALIIVPFVLREINMRNQEQAIENFYLELETANADDLVDDTQALDEAFSWAEEEGNDEELVGNSEDGGIGEGAQLEDSGRLVGMPEVTGIITIDKIDLVAPIGEGFDLDVLKFVIGHLPESAGLGDEVGNTVLAGHRSHTYSVFFNRLDEVVIGDIIILTDSQGVEHTYEVYDKYIVEPDDTSPMAGSSTHKVLTLITCHPPVVANQRLIVHAVEITE